MAFDYVHTNRKHLSCENLTNLENINYVYVNLQLDQFKLHARLFVRNAAFRELLY